MMSSVQCITDTEKKRVTRGWRDDSIDRAKATKHKDLGLDPLNTHKKMDSVTYVCNPSLGGRARDRWITELHGLPNLAESISFRLNAKEKRQVNRN